MTDRLTIHRASWLFPISRPPIADGGLAVQAGKIIEIDRFKEVVRRHSGAKIIDHPDQVLMPGLINAHAHLELSHLAHLSQEPPPASFPGWIGHMLAERTKVANDHEVIAEAARTVLADQQQQGVVAIADISNTGLTANFPSDFSGRLLCFKEYLGLRAAGLALSLSNLATEAPELRCTGHAPYSTHLDLLHALKKRARNLQQIFPLHVAESPPEHEMISHGRGEMQEFLEQRGFWDGSFQPTEEESKGAVSYLHQHGLLDSRTLCVHCIHVTEQEMDLLTETKTKICLCPGSNRYLGVGKAPVEKYLHKGILPALGTDSLTSNPKLSIWREMRLLAEEHPCLDPTDILRMATLGGAQALGLDDQLGSLEPGKKATFLAAKMPASTESATSLTELLVQQPSKDISVYFLA